jgi:glycosyltransferase involved in cell wall biosynthesis
VTPRVLVVHNRYRSEVPSGENQVVDGQIALLRGAGVEVEAYLRSSDEIVDFSWAQRLELGVRPIFSRQDVANVDGVIDRFRPDVVHVHNVYPLISPAVVSRAKSRGCQVVQTVHNSRHVCSAGTLFRDGTICTDCLGRTSFPWPAVVHGCYRGSRAQSLALGMAIARHQNTWRQLDRFLPVSGFIGGLLASTGIPRERIHVVPNSVPDPGPPAPLGQGFLFVGRLAPEKGIRLLLDAWERSGLGDETELTVVGDGPERAAVEHAATQLAGLRYAGHETPEQVRLRMRQTRSVVVPSVCFEGLPTVILESYASGRPVVATKIGSLEALVTRNVGWLAPPDQDALAATLRQSWHDAAALPMARRARELYLAQFTPSAVLAELLHVYRSLVSSPKDESLEARA